MTRRRVALLIAAAAGSAGLAVWHRTRPTAYEVHDFLEGAAAIEARHDETGNALRQAVDQARLEVDVAYLAAPGLEGRKAGSPGGLKAREYIARRLEDLGLEPVFGDSYVKTFDLPDDLVGANVAGRIAGSAPEPEVVCVVAHYDHLGVVDGELHPGADDNASGVAAVLEIARLFVEGGLSPLSDIVFLLADAEEPPYIRTDRMGSARFLAEGPYPASRFRLAVVLDVMASQPIRRAPEIFFVMGAETSPDLVRLVRSVPEPEAGARSVLMSVAMIEAEPYLPWVRKSKSDYHAFREAGRPFLFVTSGTGSHYHQPLDTPAALAYAKLAAETSFLADLVQRAALDGTPIRHYPGSVDPVHDVKVTLEIMDHVLADPGDIREETLAALVADHETLLALRQQLEGGDALSARQYRALMMIGLRLQCALTRPTYQMCTKF